MAAIPVYDRCLIVQSCLTLCDPIVACQSPLFMEFRQSPDYWSGLPCPSPGDLPNPEIKPKSPEMLCLCEGASLIAQLVKNACNAGNPGAIPGSGKSPVE